MDVYQVGHHGSINGTTQPFVNAMTPLISLIAMGPESRHLSWTAWKYGHPRREIVQMLAGATARTRATVSVKVGLGAENFTNYSLSKSIYGTGWDHNVVVTAYSDGRFVVRTNQ